MSRKSVIWFVAFLAVLSVVGVAYSAKPDDNPGQGGGPPDDKGKPDGVGRPDHARGSDGGVSSWPGANGMGGYRGSDRDGVTVGELVSAVQESRKEQWKITKEELKEMGYHGSVSGFVTAFNEEINAQKDDIREKILAGDEELTKAVVQESAERELARIRDEHVAGLYMTDTAFVVSLAGLIGGRDDANLRNAIQEEFELMDSDFKKEIYLIVTTGTEEEKQALAEQLRELIEV